MPRAKLRDLEINAIETKPGWWQLEFESGEIHHVEGDLFRALFKKVVEENYPIKLEKKVDQV